MLQFRLFVRGNKQIHVTIGGGNGWDLNNSADEVFMITAIIELFLNELDPEFLFSGSIVILNDPAADAPITLFGQNFQHRTIKLNISANLPPQKAFHAWPQMAFQLAHELTHYFVGGNSDQANNWFLETIAEVASLFFLKKMANVFSQYPVDFFHQYNQMFYAYFNERLQFAPCIDRECSQTWYQENSQTLNCNKTERKLNLQAAKMLLPLFESQPGTWNVLRFAPQAEDNHLSVFLSTWISRCPEGNHPCRHLLEECHTIFLGNGEFAKEPPKTPAG